MKQDTPFKFQYYYINEDGEYADGFSSSESFSDTNPETLIEFGLINEQREKIIRFYPDKESVILQKFEFSLDIEPTVCWFEVQRHIKVNNDGKDEQPRIYKIGYKKFMVTIYGDTGDFGFYIPGGI